MRRTAVRRRGIHNLGNENAGGYNDELEFYCKHSWAGGIRAYVEFLDMHPIVDTTVQH